MKMNFPSLFLVPLLAALSPALATAESTAGTSAKTLAKSGCPATLDYSFRKLSDAKRVNLCEAYKGQVTLIVNTASRCGFTPQFAELETLYNTYKPRGFTVLGFPSNDFGSQDPGTEKEIATFCSRTYGVKFPMFEKTHAIKSAASPFYRTLGELAGEYPQWNFHKYLLDREGRLVASLPSHVSPTDKQVTDLIEKSL